MPPRCPPSTATAPRAHLPEPLALPHHFLTRGRRRLGSPRDYSAVHGSSLSPVVRGHIAVSPRRFLQNEELLSFLGSSVGIEKLFGQPPLQPSTAREDRAGAEVGRRGASRRSARPSLPPCSHLLLSRRLPLLFRTGRAQAVGGTDEAGIAQIRYLPTPDSVPPVPAAVTKISTLPAVSFQISGPDIFRK
uniref:Uncharacterized protein n=1 Tax=Oryza nivara TaxID=4536 RepID=A0A0E0HSN5_ORYNI